MLTYTEKFQEPDGLFYHGEVCGGTPRADSRRFYLDRPRRLGDPHG